jgi:ATP-binding cassette subfamily F protein 3
MIKARDICFTYQSIPVFNQASFSIGKNTKVGLVGPNGAGTSTLFKIITKEIDIESGSLETSGNIVYVPQELKYDPVLDTCLSIREYLDPYYFCHDYELRKLCEGLELSNIGFETKPSVLSGGQKTKLALGRSLVAKPEILLLDEPTNFLDIAGRKWVMSFLENYEGMVVVVSHDLKLLDKAIDKILYIDIQYHQIKEFKGNYSKFLDLKNEQDELLVRQIENEQKKIKRMEKSIQGLYKWTVGKKVRQRVVMQRRLERIRDTLPQLPKEIEKIRLQLLTPSWVGCIPIVVKNISKSFDEPVLIDFSMSIYRNDKLALIGPNGSGKSTLIKILNGVVIPDTGEVIKDSGLKIGYYSQELENFDLDTTLMEMVRFYGKFGEDKARPFLRKFLFPADKVFQPIRTLSGGEKTRLAIAILMLQDFNLLILDEPTTYLDVTSQKIILEAIKQYTGTMIIVSHTEEFIDGLHPNRVLLLPEAQIVPYSEEIKEKIGLM